MQQFAGLARGLLSPATLIVIVWCAALTGVAIGPIDYPGQPTPVVVVLVAAGVVLFILACRTGAWCFDVWFKRQASMSAPSPLILNRVVAATSLIGIAGIALIAFDRQVLSGISNSGYAELLRCAPDLVDFIQIKRTPLLYAGYLTFSFGFVSLVLFLLKGEEIKGGVAILAQFSVLSPIGYALLYSGRMPILFAILLIGSSVLVRVSQGMPPLPRGHYLLLKTMIIVLLFGIYSSSVWSRRHNFCTQMAGLIQELKEKQRERDVTALQSRAKSLRTERPGRWGDADGISATELSKRVEQARSSRAAAPQPNSVDTLLATMSESWGVRPSAYVMSAIESGRLSPSQAMTILNTYFYLTHGIRTIDIAWRERELFSPHWGIYEIGILSPILRVFFPDDQHLVAMGAQLRSSEIYGFFPTVWVAAFIDFGLTGAIVYILIWGFAAGWSAYGTKNSVLTTPLLLLVFSLTSIFLSPVQGPLGVANSVLVLISLLAAGAAVDFPILRAHSHPAARRSELGSPG